MRNGLGTNCVEHDELECQNYVYTKMSIYRKDEYIQCLHYMEKENVWTIQHKNSCKLCRI